MSKTEVWPPLHTPLGQESDHSCVLFEVQSDRPRDFVWLKKKVRKVTRKGVANFCSDLATTDWGYLLPPELPPDVMISRFESLILGLTDRHLPLRTIRIHSNEYPWITNGIRAMSKKKKRVYRRGGKSHLWGLLQSRVDDMIEKSKSEFITRVEADPANTRRYFDAVKLLGGQDAGAKWTVEP